MAMPMNEFHMKKNDLHFIEGATLMFVCGVVIVSVLVAWAVAGAAFKDSIFGDAALVVGGIGFIAGAALDYFAKSSKH